MAKLNIDFDDDLKRRLNMKVAEKETTQKEYVSNVIQAELYKPREVLLGKISRLNEIKEKLIDELVKASDQVKCGKGYCDYCKVFLSDVSCGRPLTLSK